MEQLRILLVEHDAAFAYSIVEMIGPASEAVAGVVLVESLEQAQAKLAAESFDLILLKQALPDGAGMLNVARLRETSPVRARSTPASW